VGVVADGASFCTSKGGMAGADIAGTIGAAVMLGNSAETGGSVVEAAVVGVGTAAAPGIGVGVASAMVRVVSALTLFGRGELGSEGGIC